MKCRRQLQPQQPQRRFGKIARGPAVASADRSAVDVAHAGRSAAGRLWKWVHIPSVTCRSDEPVAVGERGQRRESWGLDMGMRRRGQEHGELHQGDVHREEEHERATWRGASPLDHVSLQPLQALR